MSVENYYFYLKYANLFHQLVPFWMVMSTNNESQDDRSRGARDKEELDRSISLSLADNTKRPHGISIYVHELKYLL